MRRPLVLALTAAVSLVSAACGQKPPAPVVAPQAPTAPPKLVPKPEAPPPPLTASQKIAISADFDSARKIILEARDLRLQGEAIEREKGRENANDTLVAARKKYRLAAQATEKWVEPELNEITQKQLDRDPELRSYFEERGTWIKEDASMGPKLNAR